MTRTSSLSLILAMLVCLTGIRLHAQRGQGNSPSTPGGRGQMARPSGIGMPQNQGMPGRESTGKPDENPGKRVGSDSSQVHANRTAPATATGHLAANPKLASKLQGILPQGTNVSDAAAGFKNVGDFVAAAHVSQNLGIPFGELKGKMMSGKSLGQAIHELRPNIDHASEAARANEQAKKTLKDSGQ